MRGLELERMTPEKMHAIGMECIRRSEAMAQAGMTKDAVRKNPLPAVQRLNRAKHELQLVVDQMIDKAAELEKYGSALEKIVQDIVGTEQ